MALVMFFSSCHLQVTEDHKLLRDRILHLAGSAGVTRMEEALQAARNKHAESGSSPSSPVRTPIGSEPSPASSSASSESLSASPSESSSRETSSTGKPKVVRSLFKFPTPVPTPATQNQDAQSSMASRPGTELTNEQIVNEMFHDAKWHLQETGKLSASLGYSSSVDPTTKKMNDMQVLIIFLLFSHNFHVSVF